MKEFPMCPDCASEYEDPATDVMMHSRYAATIVARKCI